MAEAERCPTCGATRPDDAAQGPCPACRSGATVADAGSPGAGAPATLPGVTLAGDGAGPGSGLWPPGDVLETLAATVGPMPRVALGEAATAVAPGRGDGAGPSGVPGRAGRFHILGAIAQGGMGEVFKGRDGDLGRVLAIKILLPRHGDSPDLIRRFVEEAQIAGQLQHPGVVPIHEMGTLPDRRPFFAMKLVEGRTLARILEGRQAPSDDQPRLLAIFLDVAQTMSYAHAKGVIHRDLKPANVMVGSFGEVQVMDWGLAKILARGPAGGEGSPARPEHDPEAIVAGWAGQDSHRSVAGSVMGTPAYMAPEQARGELERVDERADVFALGSILCEILTGRPAFEGDSAVAIFRHAARGETAEALRRLDDSGADGELVALAREALEPDPERRPRDAGAVARRLLGYLSGVQEKLRAAELDRAAELARAEEAKRTADAALARARAERRARRLTAALAASVLGLVALGGGVYAWARARMDAESTRLAQSIDAALADAARLRGEALADPNGGATTWAEAVAAARRAQDLLAQGRSDWPLQARVSKVSIRLAREQAEALERSLRLRADRALLAELESIRGDRSVDDNLQQTDANYASAFRRAGLDVDHVSPEEAGRWVAARSAPAELAGYLDDWTSIKRRTTGTGVDDWGHLVAMARAADPDPWRDALRARLGSTDEPDLAELRRLADDLPSTEAQPAAGLILLARELAGDGVVADRGRATRVLRRASARHPGDFWAHLELAKAVADSDAAAHLTAATALRPASPSAHARFGLVLGRLDRADEAIAEFREALRLRPDSSWVQIDLMRALNARGLLDREVAACQEAVRARPGDPWTHSDLAGALKEKGKIEEAAAEFREALRLKPDMLLANVEYGGCLWGLNRHAEAVTPWREAVRINPDDYQMHINLGRALSSAGDHAAAAAEFRVATRLGDDPVGAYEALADSLEKQGKAGEALTARREVYRLKPGDFLAQFQLAAELADRGRYEESAAVFLPNGASSEATLAPLREVAEAQPGNTANLFVLGSALESLGRHDEAVARFRYAIGKYPDFPSIHYYFGMFLIQHDRRDEAVDPLREAVRLDGDKLGAGIWMLGRNLLVLGRFDEALDVFRRAQELGKSSPGDVQRALDLIASVERLRSIDARLDAILAGTAQAANARESLDFTRRCDDLGRPAAAARLWAMAFAADPSLADDRADQLRVLAARSAARAAAGRSREVPPPDDPARALLRRQALDWLKAEFAAWSRAAASRSPADRRPAARALESWKRSGDLAILRDPAKIAALPEAEQRDLRKFWAEVDDLLARVR